MHFIYFIDLIKLSVTIKERNLFDIAENYLHKITDEFFPFIEKLEIELSPKEMLKNDFKNIYGGRLL